MTVTQPSNAARSLDVIGASDAIFSRDGKTIYVARDSSVIGVDVATGRHLITFGLYDPAGAMDLSADGRFLAVVGRDGPSTVSASYRVTLLDLQERSITSFDSRALEPAPPFFDVAFQSDGTVILSQLGLNYRYTHLISLDFSTGRFGIAADPIESEAAFVSSADRSVTFIKTTPVGDSPLYVYTAGKGISASIHSPFDPYAGAGVFFDRTGGVLAVSPRGDFFVDGRSSTIYDASLRPVAVLNGGFSFASREGLAFSPSGDRLYVLSQTQIVAFDTSTWQAVASYPTLIDGPLRSTFGPASVFGNVLQASAVGHSLSIIAANSVQILDLDKLLPEGTAGADTLSSAGLLHALDGNDDLTALSGAARLFGGRGDDTYRIGSSFAQVFEDGGQGTDTVISSVTYQLPAAVERLVLIGTDPIDGSGNEGDNLIIGSDVANRLAAGSGGIDTLRGMGGDDVLFAGTFGGTYDGGDGSDTLSYSLAKAGVRADLRAGAAQQINATGAAVDRISGIEHLTGSIYADRLFGDDSANRLTGGDGADTLDGGGGLDTLDGGAGDDVYVINRATDVIVEAAGNGIDSVFSKASYTLAAGVSVEVLSTERNADSVAIDLTGNEFVQTIVGNYGANRLTGGGGADTLIGLRGDDTYIVSTTDTVIRDYASEGNDTAIISALNYLLNSAAAIETLSAASGSAAINIGGNEFSQVINGNDGANILSSGGGGGIDTMNGGLGDDIYRVFSTGDVINDTGGFDTVYASGTSYFLYSTAAVEYLSTSEQAGTQGFYMVGNGASQVIVGNWGDNTLNGRGGDGVALPDTLIGLYGNDTYGVFSQGDVVREVAGQGNDVVFASASYQLRAGTEIEVLSAVDQSAGDAALAFTLRGNEFGQIIAGNNAGNVLDGRGGNDTLVGLGGNDTFAFTTALDGTNNVDTVRDFASGSDRVGLASDVFAAVTDGGIAAGEFVVGTAAADADDRLVYDQATGRLFFDADGNGSGAAVLFAQFGAGTVLAASDFVVVAPVASLPAA